MSIENRDLHPQLDPRFTNIYQSIGKIEGVLGEHEKNINRLTQSLIGIEKIMLESQKRVEQGINDLRLSIELEKARQEEREKANNSLKIERRDANMAIENQKKVTIHTVPFILGIITQLIVIISAISWISTMLNK